MMARSSIDRIRYRAALQDEGQLLILRLTAITAMISLGGTMAEMAAAKIAERRRRMATYRARGPDRVAVLDFRPHDLRHSLCA